MIQASDQLCADIIIGAVEGGTGYWACVSEYKHDCPPEQTRAVLHQLNDDGDDYIMDEKLVLDVAAVRHGITTILESPDYINYVLLSNRITLGILDAEWADLDADDCDVIAQVALLGKVVYG
jgi:hypothetical protein